MGILEDVKRLGLELNEDDKKELEALSDRAKTEKKDELVTKTKMEYYIGEYFTIMRPDIMAALEAAKTAENKELIKELTRSSDEKGNRICDEVGCSSIESVGQCEYCERFVCTQHNYKQGGHCCYACHLEQTRK